MAAWPPNRCVASPIFRDPLRAHRFPVSLANVVTLSRLPLLAIIVGMFYLPSTRVRALALVLMVVMLWMDAIDGQIARRRGETSLLGSVLDIASDRIVELVLWVVFASLGLIPIWIPLLILPRGVLVDSLRGVMVAQGVEPFKATTSRLAHLVVQSRTARGLYGVSKFVAFVLLALEHTLRASPPLVTVPASWLTTLHVLAYAASLVALVFCWVRAAPVLAEAWRWSRAPGGPAEPTA